MDTSDSKIQTSQRPAPVLYMAAGSESNMVYNLTQEWALAQLTCPVKVLKEPLELFTLKSTSKQALLVCGLNKKDDLINISKTIDEITAREWHWSIQVIVLSTINHPRVFKFLRKLNCTVIDSAETSLRAIKNKIQKQVQLLELSMAGQVPAFLVQMETSSRQKAPFKILWDPALALESDFWIIPQERFIYRAHEKWILTLIGPSEWAGEWKRKDPDKGNSKHWIWAPRSERQQSAEALGYWRFRGLKPKLSAGRWTFMGENPELLWISTNDTSPLVKFRTISHEEIQLAPNSAFSIRYLPEPSIENNDADPGHSPLAPSETASVKSSSFIRVVETEMIHGFLRSAKRSKSNVSVWIQKNPKRWHGKLLDFESADLSIKVQFQLGPNDNLADLTSQKPVADAVTMGNFFIPEGSIFFTWVDIKPAGDDASWHIHPQKVFYQVQRRKSTRTPIADQQSISITFGNEKLHINNISLGGLGIQGAYMGKIPIKVGQILLLRITIYNRNMQIKAEVRWIKEVHMGPDLNLFDAGLAFMEVEPQDLELLGIFTFEQDVDVLDED